MSEGTIRWEADQFTKCACEHPLSLHRVDKPHPCRGRDCGCEAFFPMRVMKRLEEAPDA